MGCGIQFTDDEADFSSEESEDEDWEKKNLPPVNFYDDFYYGGDRQQNVFVFKNSSSKKDNNHEVTVFFTKNGDKVGETKAKLPKGGFFPMVAMLSVGERVMVDFNALTG